MKYFTSQAVVKAYTRLQDCMTNKSWGYLALIKGCNSIINPQVPYEVNLNKVSDFLEDIFSLNEEKKHYKAERCLYVVFSNIWSEFFNNQGHRIPNIYDVIVWAYRRKSFEESVTQEDLVRSFSMDFNIPFDLIDKSFDTHPIETEFAYSLYSESELKIELENIGVDVSKDKIDAKKTAIVAAPGEITRGPFIQPLYAGLDITDFVLILQSNYSSLYGGPVTCGKSISNAPLQQIFYGAPGTGKSNTIKREVDNTGKKNFRVTFHPDSDYSTFVGAYKPSMESPENVYSYGELVAKLKEVKLSGVSYPCHKFAAQYWKSLKDFSAEQIKNMLTACGFTESMSVEVSKGVAIGEDLSSKTKDKKIVYKFTPQAFTKAYTAAWNTTDEVYLIIEEINRGNCAQIFGDLFQLLDRDEYGYSDYPVDADTDLSDYLCEKLKDSTRTDFPTGVKEGKKLVLPNNLYIWATMNTSDQSLFPIDSAFKRRWDWKYMKIKNHPEKRYKIEIDTDTTQDWWDFIQKINEIIAQTTSSADKQLGYFFCKTVNSDVITKETFVSKVIFYLWNDVFKDYGFDDATLFKYKDETTGEEKDLTFPDFYDEDGEKVNTTRLADFINRVLNWKDNRKGKED